MRGRDEEAIEKGVEDVEMIEWKLESQEVENLFSQARPKYGVKPLQQIFDAQKVK